MTSLWAHLVPRFSSPMAKRPNPVCWLYNLPRSGSTYISVLSIFPHPHTEWHSSLWIHWPYHISQLFDHIKPPLPVMPPNPFMSLHCSCFLRSSLKVPPPWDIPQTGSDLSPTSGFHCTLSIPCLEHLPLPGSWHSYLYSPNWTVNYSQDACHMPHSTWDILMSNEQRVPEFRKQSHQGNIYGGVEINYFSLETLWKYRKWLKRRRRRRRKDKYNGYGKELQVAYVTGGKKRARNSYK